MLKARAAVAVAAVAAVGALVALVPAASAWASQSAKKSRTPPAFTFAGTAGPGAVALDALRTDAASGHGWRRLLSDALPRTAATHVPDVSIHVVLATGDAAVLSAGLASGDTASRVVPYGEGSALVRTERLEDYVASVVGAVPAAAPTSVADAVAIALRSRAAAQAAHGYVMPCSAQQCVTVGGSHPSAAMARAARATRGIVLSAHGRVVDAVLLPSAAWRCTVRAGTVATRLAYAGTLRSIAVSTVDAIGAPDLLTLSGSAGARVVRATDVVRALGLPAAPTSITAARRIAAVASAVGDELSGLAIPSSSSPPVAPAELPAIEPARVVAPDVPAPVVAPALSAGGVLVADPAAAPVGVLPSVLSDLLGGLIAPKGSAPGAAASDGLDVCRALAASATVGPASWAPVMSPPGVL